MSDWSSFESHQQYANAWRHYLKESQEIDEGWRDSFSGATTKLKGITDKAKAASAGVSSAGKKGSAGLDSALATAAGGWDSVANFLGGTPETKDYSHLNMPAGQIGAASGSEEEDTSAEPEYDPGMMGPDPEEDSELEQWAAESAAALFQAEASGDTDALRRASEQMDAYEDHEKEAVNRHLTDLRDKEKVHSKNPDSALWEESQAYGRWKILSGIKKKVI